MSSFSRTFETFTYSRVGLLDSLTLAGAFKARRKPSAVANLASVEM